MKLKILITGGTGFLGQNLIQAMQHSVLPLEIFCLSRKNPNIPKVRHIACPDAADFSFAEIDEQFDYIVHTLALSNEKYCQDFEYAQQVNIGFTKKLLDFCRQQRRLKKLVHVSTVFVYDTNDKPPVTEHDPLFLHHSTYSFTKGISEFYVEHYRKKNGIPALSFRLSNIYGPYQPFTDSPFLVPSKIMQGLTEGEITVFDTTPRRDWLYVEDAAQAILLSLDSSLEGVVNLGSGKDASVDEIIGEIARQLDVPYRSLGKPATGPQNFYCDISLIKKSLNWHPQKNLADGIADTIAYIKKNKT